MQFFQVSGYVFMGAFFLAASFLGKFFWVPFYRQHFFWVKKKRYADKKIGETNSGGRGQVAVGSGQVAGSRVQVADGSNPTVLCECLATCHAGTLVTEGG